MKLYMQRIGSGQTEAVAAGTVNMTAPAEELPDSQLRVCAVRLHGIERKRLPHETASEGGHLVTGV